MPIRVNDGIIESGKSTLATDGTPLVAKSNASQYDSMLQIENSTHATSNRASLRVGDWYVGQDDGGDGTKDFYIYDNANSPVGHRMTIDTVGRVIKHKQPFIVGRPTGTGGSGNANSFHTIASIELTFTNSRITVPIGGRYLISFNTISDAQTGRVDAHININGSNFVNMLSNIAAGNSYHYKSATIVANLAANDYIQFNNNDWYNASTANDTWRSASVYYLG